MMFYIDNEYKCHTTNPNSALREVETDFFDGKCDTFIEGYRFVPSGESWTRSDGVVFTGEMIAPWKDFNELAAVQHEYEQQLLQEYRNKEQELNNIYNEGVNSI